METRTQIVVRGMVQGVGFRPYIYLLANRRALRGRVFNNPAGVIIDVEGEARAVEQFLNELGSNPPPLALIETVECRDVATPANYPDFRIVESASAGKKFVPISADVATCRDCLRELFDPCDRRFRYPFLNCTNCGPRFTIIEDIPYDRARTTMCDFAMCEACRAEYENPLDRRFHAEPTACPACGPQLYLRAASGDKIAVEADALRHARQSLREGKIIAIKGLGGFHLACDALNVEAVTRLRHRKYREEKPFALMAASLAEIRRYCFVSPAEEELLRSAPRPIVLLERKPEAEIPPAVAPGVQTLGWLLPYTPLHYLLFDELAHPLVMTSGNVSDEPICYEDGEAVERLRDIADYFLLHNRRIHMRTDDSVMRMQTGQELILRRSRGYAPAPLKLAFKFTREILACGAELKNTFCLTRDNYAFLSHHIGNLENLETLRSFEQGIEHFKRLFNLRPEVIAYDLHPEYLSTKYACALGNHTNSPLLIGVQHHHAHIASCMADNRIDGAVIGVALDGLGYGTDGRLWGGEFFVADFAHAERVAHLDYVPLPGGVQAIHEPWRMAAVYLQRAWGDDFLQLELPFVRQLNQHTWAALRRMIVRGTNSPETSSMGRLFDAVASLLGLRTKVSYEGQAAIELEAMADRCTKDGYVFELTEAGLVKAEPVIRHVTEDLLAGLAPPIIAARFHLAVANLIACVARRVRAEHRLNRVVLSGGVLQNMLLLELVTRALKAERFEVYTHHRVPPNDGGIALGQAVVAEAMIREGRV